MDLRVGLGEGLREGLRGGGHGLNSVAFLQHITASPRHSRCSMGSGAGVTKKVTKNQALIQLFIGQKIDRFRFGISRV